MREDWKAVTKKFFDESAWRSLRYEGLRIGKNPLDLWIYQEIIEEVKPALIVEFGTMCGGSGLWFCHQLDRLKLPSKFVSVEKSSRHVPPNHPKATWLKGKVLSKEIEEEIKRMAAVCGGPVLISEDSNHMYSHVLAVLDTYAEIVTVGSYFIVEDGVLDHVCNHPQREPYRAIHDWLPKHSEFRLDTMREKFGLTFHCDGWLQRTRK